MLFFFLLTEPRALASPGPASVQLQSASVEGLIRDQLAAFEVNDAARAWRHVAPSLQRQFGTAEGFLQVVKRGYSPMLRVRDLSFGEPTVFDGGPARWIDFTGADGKRWRALYLLEVQPDGSWRTSGCLLLEVEPVKLGVHRSRGGAGHRNV